MSKEKRMVKYFEGNGSPFRTVKINRNDPCKCGSSKKAKNCCGVETKMYHSKEKADPNKPSVFSKEEMDKRIKQKS